LALVSDVVETGYGSLTGDQRDQQGSCRDRAVDPDRVLVDQVVTGDLGAFETLVQRYQVRIFNYALTMLRDTGEAEDVAQETFIRAYRSLRRFRGESSFKTWLYAIATNTARTARDRRGRRQRMEEQSLDDYTGTLNDHLTPIVAPTAETALITREVIDRALANLSDNLRVAVVLRDVQGLDYREIAKVTGVPIGTVESRIFRARQQLRTLLQPLRSGGRSGNEPMQEMNHAVR